MIAGSPIDNGRLLGPMNMNQRSKGGLRDSVSLMSCNYTNVDRFTLCVVTLVEGC